MEDIFIAGYFNFCEVWRPPEVKNQGGAQILVLQSHSEVVKMSSILFFGAESSTKITGGRKTLKNKFLQKFLQGSTFTKKSQDF